MLVAMRVLVAEDHEVLATAIAAGLRREGMAVDLALRGHDALDRLSGTRYDVVVLDRDLPGVHGDEVCRVIVAGDSGSRVLMLTAASTVSDKVDGLGLGADDYLAKPFSVLELVARVKALLRRVDAMAKDSRIDAGTLQIVGLTIDPLTREAAVEGRRIELTPREFDLLYFFAQHPGKVYSRMDLLNAVWGYQHEGYEHTVNTHINRLRAKIEADPAQPTRILTVWGHGYKLAVPSDGHTPQDTARKDAP
jgi:two-component system OmpR family response regulator